MVKLNPEATARPGRKRGHYSGATNLKRNTRAKTNGKRRAKVLKWQGEKKEKNWKIHVERTAGDWGSGRFKRKAEEGKGQDKKKGNKIGKRSDNEKNNVPDPMISYIHMI